MCGQHCHILVNDHAKLDLRSPFEESFYKSIDKVKMLIHGRYVQTPEFSRQCVRVIPIYDIDPLVGYVTDEFWKSVDGDFIKPIYKHGLVM